MMDVLYYGGGQDSQKVIEAVEGAVKEDVGYRFEPASRREDNRSAWGVRVADDVDRSVVTNALEKEFGTLNAVNPE